ncbi:MAG: hypothetical protein LBG57_11735 [Treponema sp.]|jgi:hypothetical protein|nr:hypothetical protein [Treponema sp.]
MEPLSTTRLDLRAPLCYAEAPDLKPFVYAGGGGPRGEAVFCFELDPGESRSIEPDRKRFLGALVFAARAEGGAAALRIPPGQYLFSQKREALGREDCIDLAVEQQKDGLWERLKPESLLYLRYLFEDGSPVTQLFRPCG